MIHVTNLEEFLLSAANDTEGRRHSKIFDIGQGKYLFLTAKCVEKEVIDSTAPEIYKRQPTEAEIKYGQELAKQLGLKPDEDIRGPGV